MQSTEDVRGGKVVKTSSGSNGKPFNASSIRKRVAQRRVGQAIEAETNAVGMMPFALRSLLPQAAPSEDGRKRLEAYLALVETANRFYIMQQLRRAECQVRGLKFVPEQVVNAIYRSAMREVKANGQFVMANGVLLKLSVPQPSYTVPTLKTLDLRQAQEASPSDHELYRSMMQYVVEDAGAIASTQGE